MMKIPYIAPAQSQAEIDKATGLVASMRALVTTLTQAGQQPGNQFAILGPAERLQLRQQGYPATLVNNIAFFTEQVMVQQGNGFVEQNQFMVGFTSDAFDPDLYASDSIKSALIQSHRGRCAYCETLIHHAAYGDVEHFRPKAAYTTPGSPALYRPAYFNLAYDPHNLFYSCQLCNEVYKKNEFAVIGPRAPEVTVDAEQPAFINPYLEDPRNYIRFNPMNGYAYAFDLAVAFYTATQGWGPPQTATELWRDPTKIPGQNNYQGVPISNPAMNTAYQNWLPTVQNQQLWRGSRTISALGLNRRALVRARVNQLRQLRAMAWTASSNGPDQAAAQQLMTALGGNDPAAALVAPEYVSLCIDAIQTWNAQGPGGQPWIDGYNQILHAFIPAEAAVAPPPYNDALSYLVFENEAHLAGRRRLVYISSSDRVYGNPDNRKGIFLAIDWEEQLANTVIVTRDGNVRQQMSLLDLVNLLDENRSAYNIFRNSELWVVGDFPPFHA